MLFNSATFIVFLILFFALWPRVAPHKQLRWIYIIIASFVFYGWWNWKFLFLIIGTGLWDFYAALAIAKFPHYKKIILASSIFSNIGSLVVFKYLFFFTSYSHSLAPFIPIIKLTLPVGISFYTFQSMSYTIDVYRGHMPASKNVFHFFAFLSLFPQLVAGPIIRASDLMPALEKWQNPSETKQWEGTKLIVFGYFKKIVLADSLAPVVNAAFAQAYPAESCPYWWIIITMFAVQIYCDFSGYSDIARGLAKWMGYEFMVNFNHPYIANSFRDFWNRWHISLSTWFRDYVYIPLGGNHGGKWATHKNMWITMVLSGFWHGANWTFLIWGGLHALFLSVERITQWPKRLGAVIGGKFLVSFVIIALVWIAWVFFRAESLGQAMNVVTLMFDFSKLNLAPILEIPKSALLFLGIAFAWEASLLINYSIILPSKVARILEPVFIACVLMCGIYLRGPGSAFIYFQF